MADIALANSTYSTGTNDTASTLVNNVTATDAQQWNGVATAAVGIETILGTGTTLKGNKADLVARLAVGIDADGLLKLDTDAAISGPLNVAQGGTGVTTLTDGAVLLGSGTADVTPLALPSATRALVHTGSGDPSWLTGLLYHGPTSVGSGSTRSHEGAVTISSNQDLGGVHLYSTFTLNSSTTITVPDKSRRLVIMATDSITINGTIDGVGGGASGGGQNSNANGTPGLHGGTAAGGGGGAFPSTYDGGAGGSVYLHGTVVAVGGSGGANGTPTAGSAAASSPTGSDAVGIFTDPWSHVGGAGGGSGGPQSSAVGGDGGDGGATIVLMAPVVTLGASATLNSSGEAGGSPGSNSGGGGGGGAGNIIIICRSYTDSGATFTMNGGAGGTGSGTGANGGAGGAGVKQIMIYA